MEEAKANQKKGLSKGCIIGIVVASVVVVAILLGGYLVWSYKDTILKNGAIYTINTVKTQMIENPIEGVDAERFVAVADLFVKRLEQDEALDPEKMQGLAMAIQGVAQNIDNPSAEMINSLLEGMLTYYPDLAELLPAKQPVEDSVEAVPAEE